jgi:2-phosphosulfolactate phosphatase
MSAPLDATFTLAEIEARARQGLGDTVCVVFDVLRATSSIVSALAHGAAGVVPVADIASALAVRQRLPEVLLAGEREGERIRAAVSGGVDFDLGNSPREFTPERIRGRTVVMTTTNGTRALHACAGAARVWAGAFLNLGALARALERLRPTRLLLVGSGTRSEAAFEDALAAGAVVEALPGLFPEGQLGDGALMARELYRRHAGDLTAALARSRNGRRLLARPELRDDVAFCAARDRFELVPVLEAGVLRGTGAQ